MRDKDAAPVILLSFAVSAMALLALLGLNDGQGWLWLIVFVLIPVVAIRAAVAGFLLHRGRDSARRGARSGATLSMLLGLLALLAWRRQALAEGAGAPLPWVGVAFGSVVLGAVERWLLLAPDRWFTDGSGDESGGARASLVAVGVVGTLGSWILGAALPVVGFPLVMLLAMGGPPLWERLGAFVGVIVAALGGLVALAVGAVAAIRSQFVRDFSQRHAPALRAAGRALAAMALLAIVAAAVREVVLIVR